MSRKCILKISNNLTINKYYLDKMVAIPKFIGDRGSYFIIKTSLKTMMTTMRGTNNDMKEDIDCSKSILECCFMIPTLDLGPMKIDTAINDT